MSKKKREEDAWMWITQPHMPGVKMSTPIVPPRRGTAISSYGPGLSLKEQATFWFQQQSLEGGLFPAYLYYGQAGLADPKIAGEAAMWSAALGISKEAGFVMALIFGFTLAGAIGVVIDPHHQWEGGLDETTDYQVTSKMYAELKAPWKTQYLPTQ